MILLMGTTAIRIGEACNLRVGAIDRRGRRLLVAFKDGEEPGSRGRHPCVGDPVAAVGRSEADRVRVSVPDDRVRI
jgi:integrase